MSDFESMFISIDQHMPKITEAIDESGIELTQVSVARNGAMFETAKHAILIPWSDIADMSVRELADKLSSEPRGSS